MANTTNNDAQVMLRMHDIHKSFGDLAVLKGIDVEVRRGEVLAIIGPSGSGKSTLLRCINYLEPPDGGTITVGDIVIDAGNPIGRAALSGLRRRVDQLPD